MKFEEMLPGLKEGKLYTRPSWDQDKMEAIFKQNDTAVQNETIPTMTSLPNRAKEVLKDIPVFWIHYRCQVIKIDLNTGIAESYVPNWDDIFARDWTEVDFPVEE